MKSNNYPLSRNSGLVIQKLKNEVLVYDLTKNKAYCLNETSAMVWQECDGAKSVVEISQNVSKKLKSNVSEDIVELALNQFKTDNLLENTHEFATKFDGLSRREIVKRVGFASMVALPVISALIAPTALHAASNGCAGTPLTTCVPGSVNPTGCPCAGTPQCTTGNVCPIAPGNQTGICTSINGTPANPICVPGNTSGLSDTCCPCIGTPTCKPGNVCPIAPGSQSGICTLQ